MPREDYQAKLRELRENVLYMSELVMDRLRMSLKALESRDEDLAWQVIEGDSEINDLYLDIEQDCVDLLALQQPVAGDLRLIVASFKIITDLERIGDLATNLGDYAKEAKEYTFPEVDIQEIGRDALDMVEKAMEAYEEENTSLCYEIANRDDDLDAKCEKISEVIIRELIETEYQKDESEVEQILQDVSRLLLTVRDLERVGDHAVNISARTLYMIENEDELIW